MDKSEKYILMCEKAQEVQARRKYREDVVDIGNNLYNTGDYYCNKDSKDLLSLYENKTFLVGSNEGVLLTNTIWLPTLDQLIRIWAKCRNYFGLGEKVSSVWINNIFVSNKKLIEILQEENEFISKNYDSMEKILLSILMKEKYNKIWIEDKQDWILI